MNAPSTAELVLRMVISLAIMGVLLWGVVKVGRGRRGRSLLGVVGGAKADHIEVRARRQLTRSASLSLVQVGSRTLLLGVGERGVAVLAEGGDLTADALTADPAATTDVALTVTATAPVELGATTDPEHAGTRAPGATGPHPERIGVMDALRELTVRR